VEEGLNNEVRYTIIMAPSGLARRLSWFLSILMFGSLLPPVRALYFYMDGTTQKCFYEELPKDTLVVGMGNRSPLISCP